MKELFSFVLDEEVHVRPRKVEGLIVGSSNSNSGFSSTVQLKYYHLIKLH